MLQNVFVISIETYTALGSSKSSKIRLAADCCLVFNTSISFSSNENIAACEPAIEKEITINMHNKATKSVVLCNSAESCNNSNFAAIIKMEPNVPNLYCLVRKYNI